MSSHREAPGLSMDPAADNTDVYAFVSPDAPDTVTLIANYLPFEYPAGGPNFFEFAEDVSYAIHIDNNGDGKADVTYQFRFKTTVANPDTFLYNTGPITSLDSPNWNRRQTYSVTRVKGGTTKILASNLACPPVNIGPRSTPNYGSLAADAIHDLSGRTRIFAGQRQDAFFVDLGSVFDLGTLRPFENLHLIPTPAAAGVNDLSGFNVHTIAIQVPSGMLTRDGSTPSDAASPKSVVGVWASASRRTSTMRERNGTVTESGPWRQVSRLGNPLINEAVIPMSRKDEWNADSPANDSSYAKYVRHPELAALIPVLYPGVFPNLAGLTAPRADLQAILLTGLPSGIVPGFQNNTGPVLADMLRLNMAIPPASSPNPLGLIGGDPAGFPNGRRLVDDVFTIELRAIAGVTYPLVDPSYTPDGAAAVVTDGVSAPEHPTPYPGRFPYLNNPIDGYSLTPPS